MRDWQITVQWSRATDQGQLFLVQASSMEPESRVSILFHVVAHASRCTEL